jgi:hypothetical protein
VTVPTQIRTDVIPQVCRPSPIEAAIAEVEQIRVTVREAAEANAAAQQTVDDLERDDVENAARRVRSGQTIGALPASVTKARDQLERTKREHAARTLALEQAEGDLVELVRAGADEWVADLGDQVEQARERALSALVEFEQALADVRAAAGARLWIEAATRDQRFDRPAPTPKLGSGAPTSARLAPNGQALAASAVLGYCRELVEPPAAAQPTAVLRGNA